jgi:glycosyltransferase involved in cell wall biosynthesis
MSKAGRNQIRQRDGEDRYDETAIGVVIPAFNEAEFIGDVIDSIPEFVDRVYVVDDCSTDGTWETIQNHAAQTNAPVISEEADELYYTDGGKRVPVDHNTTLNSETRTVPVRHSVNRGRGGAVKTGYQLALLEDMDVVAVMDGDGQMDPSILDRIIDPVINGQADYSKGNRLDNRTHRKQMSNWRLFGNIVLSLLTKVASGYWKMWDPQNGYTAVSAEVLSEISIDRLYDDYGFLNDLLIRLGAHGKRVADVPMKAIYDAEESGIKYQSFVVNLSALLVQMFLWRLWVSYGNGTLQSNTVQTAN